MMAYLREHKSFFRAFIFSSIVFLLGGLVGWWLTRTDSPCQTDLSFINPSIACGEKAVVDKTNYVSLRGDLVSYIDTEKKEGNVNDVAVYFRDLNNGPSFGLNEYENFSPASLLKLPLAFVFFDIEEEDGSILDRLVQYTNVSTTEVQTFVPTVSIKPNQSYSIETLLSNMLTYSDNVSYQVLVEYLNGQPGGSARIGQTFHDLGIIDPKSDVQNTVTVRGYASLFRLLYNASYLNTADSEKILSWLANSDFNVGLVAGVPEGIAVAHKFGEREIRGLLSVSQLHDCGIVYYPNNPYELCIMTRGTRAEKLPAIIGAISRMVYDEVDSRRF